MALKLFQKGQSSSLTNFNIDVPTNPKATTESASLSGRIFSAIYPDDSTSDNFEEIINGAGITTPYSNLTTTNGFRINCYDSTSQVGIRLNSLNISSDSFEYYVLIHSDNHLKHHFAKITEIIKSDVTGDSFDFTPKLGNEILKDTKFMLFKFPKNSTAIAVSAGLSLDLQNELIISRPHYFFRLSTDKKDELDHNTKYFMRVKDGSSSPITLDNTITLKTTFLTAQDYDLGLIDYSKYTLKVKMVDTLRTLDLQGTITLSDGSIYNIATSGSPTITNLNPTLDTSQIFVGMAINHARFSGIPKIVSIGTNEITLSQNAISTGVSPILFFSGNEGQQNNTLDYTDYKDAFPHARADGDNLLLPVSNNFTSTGERRYLHYDFSPEKCNKLPNAMDSIIYESAGNRGAFAEVKAVDSFRILPKKIVEFNKLKARHILHRGTLSDFKEFDWAITNISTLTITLDTNNANLHFVAGNEIKIGNLICLVDSVTTDTIVLESAFRLEEESTFTSGTPPITSTDKVSRRAYNHANNTLMTDLTLVSDRSDSLFVTFIDVNFIEHYATVTAVNSKQKLLTLSLNSSAYTANQTLFIDGQYLIEYQKFDGEIESIDSYQQDGQTLIELKGRNKFNKLLSPIINKSTLFSDDILYSSETFYSELERIKDGATDAFLTASYGSDFVNFTDSLGNGISVTTSTGDNLFIKTKAGNIKYVGKILSGSSGGGAKQLETLANTQTSMGINGDDTIAVYKQKKKEYVFNKALASSHLVPSSTSLSGSSNKGVFFTGGRKLVGGNESTRLVGSSFDNNPNAVGYHISNIRNMKSDNFFQSTLGNDADSETYQNFDTVNTLMDFTVVNVSNSGANKLVEIAPYIPLSLASIKHNYANTRDITNATQFSSQNLGTISAIQDTFKIVTLDFGFCSTNADKRRLHNKPLYVSTLGQTDYTFVGFILQVNRYGTTGSSKTIISLDRGVVATVGQQLSILEPTTAVSDNEFTTSDNKLNHELNIINAGHLHTGKTISLVHPSFGADGLPKNFDVDLENSVASVETTSFRKYGDSVYRLFNIEKGDIKTKEHGLLGLSSRFSKASEQKASVPFYASGYRLGAGYNYESSFDNGLQPVNKITTHSNIYALNNLPIESRGQASAGSRFFDSNIFPAGNEDFSLFFPTFATTDTEHVSPTNDDYLKLVPYSVKEYLNILDISTKRMFLFSNCDISPYSRKRTTSLLFGTKTIGDYSILGIKEPFSSGRSDVKDDVLSTETINLNDDSYSSSNIVEANKTITNLKGFSMMRLTEVCLDWAFNQVNPESPIDKKATIPQLDTAGYSFSSIGTGITVTASNYEVNALGNYSQNSFGILADGNANWAATPGGGHSLVVGDIITDGNGRYIGTVASFASPGATTNSVCMLDRIPYRTDGDNYFTGQVFKIRRSDILTDLQINGKGGVDTFTSVEEDIHMFKSAFMSRGKFEFMKQKVAFTVSATANDIDTGSEFLLITLPKEDGTTANFYIYYSIGGSSAPSSHASTYPTYGLIEVPIDGINSVAYSDKQARLLALYNALIGNSTFMSHVYSIGHASNTIHLIPVITVEAFNNPTIFDMTGFPTNPIGEYSAPTSTMGGVHKMGYGQDGTVSFNNDEILNTAIIITGSHTFSAGEGYGGSKDSSWRQKSDETLGGKITDESYIMHSVLPITTNLNQARIFYPFSIFRWLANLPKSDKTISSKGLGLRTTTTGYWEFLYKFFNTVCLERYDIEDNVGAKAVAGMSTPYIRGIFRKEYTTSLNKALYGINYLGGSFGDLLVTEANTITKAGTSVFPRERFQLTDNQEFALKEFDGNPSTTGYNQELREADGALTVFKPKLFVSADVFATESTQIGLGNHTQYKYTFTSGNYRGASTNVSQYTWLNFVDLTGCYLASSRGKKYRTDGSSTITDTTGLSVPSSKTTDYTPETLAYVLSHELDTTNAVNKHIIIVDKRLNTNELYSLLQPNHRFSHSFSPNNIRLNELSSKYTKLANENSMYKNIKNYSALSNALEINGEREGVMSMYVIADIDGQTNSGEIVIRNPNTLSDNNESIIDLPPNMIISDGENTHKVSVEMENLGDTIGYYLSLSDMYDLKGIISLTESITLTVGKEFDSESKRCLIGSGVKICNEAEDLINNLLEEEGLEFNLDSVDYPLFVAPNFQGSTLMDALHFLTEKKDKTIVYENDLFSIKDKESNDFFSNILINDTGEYQILEYEKVRTTFDLHNEIIVYGNSHKATKKDLRSIQKRGRKTLEVFERELITQDEVNKRAKNLLKIHSTLNTKLIITVSSKGLGQLKAGDLIQVQIERENIERGQFLVLQIEHKMTGLLKLELGRYSKQLEDRFAELLIANKKTNSAIRNQKFSEPTTGFDFIDNTSVKEIRLHIRKRTTSGTVLTLGFGTTLNTSTIELGFEGGGSITLTTLIDEDLL